jgi:hypothetical protein
MRFGVLCLLLLSGCDSPAPAMMGAQRDEVVRNGRDYVVYHTRDTVEVIRLGYARRGEHQGIRADMIDMIPVVTGCTLDAASVRGDSGEIRGRLRCKDST